MICPSRISLIEHIGGIDNRPARPQIQISVLYLLYSLSASSSLFNRATTHFFCNTNLSFKPNLHSGVPLRYALIRICPSTSARSTAPANCQTICRRSLGDTDSPSLLISRLTVSMTSTNASFFLYFTSDLRHDVAPVAWMVILLESSRYFISWTLAASHLAESTDNSKLRLDTLGRNIHLESINLRVLRVTEVHDF